MMILESLKEKQRQENLSDQRFARKLGVSRRLWGMTRVGIKDIGMSLLKAAAKTYPDLDADIMAFLRNGVNHD